MSSARPPLPVRHANPLIQNTVNHGSLPPVKYQVLNCQGQEILVGRMKIETPTPSGHAFILRRFDTGAVSLTTMFRAAFPNAPDHEEKSELQWVKENHDLSGNNGGPHNPQITRLAGVWVSPDLARTLGKTYALGDLITAVVEATPDPHASYRRSGKPASSTPNNPPSSAYRRPGTAPSSISDSPPVAAPLSPSSAKSVSSPKAASRTLPTPSPTAAPPNPSKRRKESSPAPAPAPPPVRAITPTPVAAPRRSTRTKSPAPKSSIAMAPKTPKPPKLARREEVLAPEARDEASVDEEGEVIVNGVTGSELYHQDVEEQQTMIKDLQAKRQAAKESVEEEEEEEEEDQMAVDAPANLKRGREEEGEALSFEFKEPEVGERAIATNSRVGRFHLEPRTRSFAWGVAAFAVGMGAVSFLPSFF